MRLDTIAVVFSDLHRMSMHEEDELQQVPESILVSLHNFQLQVLSDIPEHVRDNIVVFITASDGSRTFEPLLRRFGLSDYPKFTINTACTFQKQMGKCFVLIDQNQMHSLVFHFDKNCKQTEIRASFWHWVLDKNVYYHSPPSFFVSPRFLVKCAFAHLNQTLLGRQPNKFFKGIESIILLLIYPAFFVCSVRMPRSQQIWIPEDRLNDEHRRRYWKMSVNQFNTFMERVQVGYFE